MKRVRSNKAVKLQFLLVPVILTPKRNSIQHVFIRFPLQQKLQPVSLRCMVHGIIFINLNMITRGKSESNQLFMYSQKKERTHLCFKLRNWPLLFALIFHLKVLTTTTRKKKVKQNFTDHAKLLKSNQVTKWTIQNLKA